MKTALIIALIVISIILAIIVMMQEGKGGGLTSLSGGGETYWSKNKGNSIEGALEKYTKIGGFLFMAIALVINFIN